MLPVLSARESLTATTTHAMGSGMLERDRQYQIRTQWYAAAQLSPAKTSTPSPDDLRAMGVDPRKVRRRRTGG
jgi:hypothetical protein